jgi:hypothetical protein
MLTMPYDNDYFIYAYGLVFMTRLGGLILSTSIFYYKKPSGIYMYTTTMNNNIMN